MNEEEKIESSQEDSKPLSSEKVNETNSPESVIEQTELSIINEQPSTETMEVHKHPHHVTHKKKWGEYLLEFFMLFLAVTLGFIAENIRESIGDRAKEKEYIVSMIEDLKADTAGINKHIIYRQDRKIKLDSLSLLLKMPDYTNYTSQIYYYGRWVPRAYFFNANDGTLQQLKTGGMRLITHKAAVSAITNFDAQVKITSTQTSELENQQVNEFTSLMTSIFDGNVMDEMYGDSLLQKPAGNPPLLTNDKKAIARLVSELHFVKSLNNRNIYFENKLKQQAANTINVLQNEYHLKDE